MNLWQRAPEPPSSPVEPPPPTYMPGLAPAHVCSERLASALEIAEHIAGVPKLVDRRIIARRMDFLHWAFKAGRLNEEVTP